MNRVVYLLMNPYCVFYVATGVPPFDPLPPEPLEDEDDSMFVDVTWAEAARVGDKVDYFVSGVGTWVQAEIADISPTRTEMQLRHGGNLVWMSIEAGKVAPLGEGPKRMEAIAEAKAATSGGSTASALPPVDESWREHLHPGYLCDAKSALKEWFQSVVLAERVTNGVDTVKVRACGRRGRARA